MPLVPFLLYVFVTSFTPGPNNMMAMAYANKYGFRKSLRFIFGVTAGIAVHLAVEQLLQSLFVQFHTQDQGSDEYVGRTLSGVPCHENHDEQSRRKTRGQRKIKLVPGRVPPAVCQSKGDVVRDHCDIHFRYPLFPFEQQPGSLFIVPCVCRLFGYRLLGNLWRNLSKDSLQIRKSFPYIHGTLIALQRCFHICRIDTVPVQDFSNTRPSTNKQR